MLAAHPSKADSAAEKLRCDLLRSIKADRLSVGDRIHSERTLAKRFNVSYMTLRRALAQLVEQGLLERRPRRGVFVGSAAAAAGQPATGRVRGLFYLSTMGAIYADFQRALSAKMDEAGIDLVWSMVQEVVRPEAVKRVAGWNEDAFIIVGAMPQPLQNELLRRQARILIVDLDHEGLDADNLLLDDEGCAFDAATRFFAAGRMRVAYAGARIPQAHPYYGRQVEWPNSIRRAMGVRRAYVSRGQRVDEALFESADHTAGARELGRRWFRSRNRPDAIVCFDSAIAAGLADAASDAGLHVPRDVSLVGVGGPAGAAAKWNVTHYAFDWKALGEQAAEMCRARLADPAMPFRKIAMPGVRVEGSTTQPVV